MSERVMPQIGRAVFGPSSDGDDALRRLRDAAKIGGTAAPLKYAAPSDAEVKARAAAPLLAERGATHGDWKKSAEYIVTQIQHLIDNGLRDLPPAQQAALIIIRYKEARILFGQSRFRDHWRDIIGYVKLAMTETDPDGRD